MKGTEDVEEKYFIFFSSFFYIFFLYASLGSCRNRLLMESDHTDLFKN